MKRLRPVVTLTLAPAEDAELDALAAAMRLPRSRVVAWLVRLEIDRRGRAGVAPGVLP
jgi:hypothetical protein